VFKGVLLATKSCPFCKIQEDRLQKEIESGEIKILYIEDSEEAKKLAKAFNISAVPTILGVARNKEGKIGFCTIDTKAGKVLECKEVEGVDLG